MVDRRCCPQKAFESRHAPTMRHEDSPGKSLSWRGKSIQGKRQVLHIAMQGFQ